MGQANLSGGTVTVNSSCVNGNSIIQLSQGYVNGGTQGILRVSARNAGANTFQVTSSSSNDASNFYWQIMNP
jgi:hypothetical protein